MRLVRPSVSKIQQYSGLDGVFKAVADAAKICYQTEKSKLSDKEFVQMLIKKGHLRSLEMGTVYLIIPDDIDARLDVGYLITDIQESPWSKWTWYANGRSDGYGDDYITTNLRVVYELCHIDEEGNDVDILDKDFWLWKYLSEPTDHHHLRHTFDFICSRGCGDDFRTHVTLSAVMESTRYCNYANDKFGNEISFIEPYWVYSNDDINDLEEIERIYLKKIAKGYQPQMGKNFLPLSVKTQLRMCGFWDAWTNFIEKRNSEAAYPECRRLAEEVERGLKEDC